MSDDDRSDDDRSDDILDPDSDRFLATGGAVRLGFVRQQTADLEPGIRLGVYEVDELIGSGGMASVHGAHRADGQFEQRVAIKVLDTLASSGRRVAAQGRLRGARAAYRPEFRADVVPWLIADAGLDAFEAALESCGR